MAPELTYFRKEVPFAKRLALSQRIAGTHPDRIPIIVEPYRVTDPRLKRKKYLAPDDGTMGGVISTIQKELSPLNPASAICFYVNGAHRGDIPSNDNDVLTIVSNTFVQTRSYVKKSLPDYYNMILVPVTESTGSVYKRYKDDDGFLYLTYTAENTFG